MSRVAADLPVYDVLRWNGFVKMRLTALMSHGKSFIQRFIPAVPSISPRPSKMQPPPSPIRPEATELLIAAMNKTKARTPAIVSAAAAAVIAKPVSDTTSAKTKMIALTMVMMGNQTGNVMISKISLSIVINRAVLKLLHLRAATLFL